MDIVDISETQHEQMKRIDAQIERDRKLADRFFLAAMGMIFLLLAAAFYLLHSELTQIHIARLTKELG